MRISFSEDVNDLRIAQTIGRVRAVTGWHAPGAACTAGDWNDTALKALVREAEDFEADAIVGVGYEVDQVADSDLAPLPLRRVAATGLAVRLARA